MRAAFTTEELRLLGPPLEIGRSNLACDRIGCDQLASHLIPGAAVCEGCLEAFTYDWDGGCGAYDLPLEELVGGPEWRRARDLEYEELLVRRADSFAVRHAAWEERLDQLAEDAAVALIESVGCLP